MKIKLSRKRNNRKSLTRNLVTSFILHESVTTTEAKSKLLIKNFQRLIKNTKNKDLEATRYAKSILFDNNAVKKLFEDIHPRLVSPFGSIMTLKIGNRSGDNAKMKKNILILKPIVQKEDKDTNKETKKQKDEK